MVYYAALSMLPVSKALPQVLVTWLCVYCSSSIHLAVIRLNYLVYSPTESLFMFVLLLSVNAHNQFADNSETETVQ